MPATITLEMLKDANACREQYVLFKREFGESVEVTEGLAVKHAGDFDFDFAAENFLSGEASEAFAEGDLALWEEYESAIAPAWAVYQEAISPIIAQYEKGIAPMLEEYNKAKAALTCDFRGMNVLGHPAYVKILQDYEEARAPLLRAYGVAREPIYEAYGEAKAPLLRVYDEKVAKLFARLYISENGDKE